MYLTRFRVNTGRTDARRLLEAPHRLHGAVNMSFPDLPSRDGAGPRVLWRVDRNSTAETLLYVVSPNRPDLTHLVEQAGWPAADGLGWTTFDYDGFLTGLAEGSTWAFRLTANPVHNIRHEDHKEGERTQRVAHKTRYHQLRWLLDRQEKSGFEIVSKPPERRLLDHGDEHELVVRDQRPLQFNRPPAKDRRQDVRFTRVTYDGRLRVTDPDVLRRTLTHGLGKAKAYGCGLMTLAPLTRADG
ncbi:type I-E CRISPR-associated protein Cas6/Cse3/CasE [Streptomyces sp. DT171]|uniref:type I-E CRISPR-associated protein Cas6/Cse3/CasE n=1 Tax=Streptomyces sp. DT171 TaxID=3416524 RepID=UPI003CEF6E89